VHVIAYFETPIVVRSKMVFLWSLVSAKKIFYHPFLSTGGEANFKPDVQSG